MRSFRANTDKVAWRYVGGETILIHADTSAYYGFNVTGTHIWATILTTPLTVDEMAFRVSARYGLPPDAVQNDVDVFIQGLHEEGLLLEEPAAAGIPLAPKGAPEVAPAAVEYAAPTLVRFGELEQLVLSGE